MSSIIEDQTNNTDIVSNAESALIRTGAVAYDKAIPIRQRILDTRSRIETDFVHFANDLFIIWEQQSYLSWGYDGLRVYVEDELGMKYRKARYFIAIAKAVYDLKLDWADVQSLGWTKASRLLPYLKKSDNIDVGEWFDIARNNSVKELAQIIAENKRQALPDLTVEAAEENLATYTFRANAEQAQLLNDTLEHVKRMFDVESNMDALESLMYDWQMRAGSEVESLPVTEIIKWVESIYNVKLTME